MDDLSHTKNPHYCNSEGIYETYYSSFLLKIFIDKI